MRFDGFLYTFAGYVWAEVKALWSDGLLEYVSDLWNIVDFITNSFFLAWIQLRAASWFVVHRDLWWYNKDPWYPREHWHDFDPMLLSEGCFGAAMIFRCRKLLLYLLTVLVNNTLFYLPACNGKNSFKNYCSIRFTFNIKLF